MDEKTGLSVPTPDTSGSIDGKAPSGRWGWLKKPFSRNGHAKKPHPGPHPEPRFTPEDSVLSDWATRDERKKHFKPLYKNLNEFIEYYQHSGKNVDIEKLIIETDGLKEGEDFELRKLEYFEQTAKMMLDARLGIPSDEYSIMSRFLLIHENSDREQILKRFYQLIYELESKKTKDKYRAPVLIDGKYKVFDFDKLYFDTWFSDEGYLKFKEEKKAEEAKKSWELLTKIKKQLPPVLAGMVGGAALNMILRSLVSSTGLVGLAAGVTVGGLSIAALEGFREHRKIQNADDKKWAEVKSMDARKALRDEIDSRRLEDLKRIARAGLKGGLRGAVGGAIGFEVIEAISGGLDLLAQNGYKLPEFKNPIEGWGKLFGQGPEAAQVQNPAGGGELLTEVGPDVTGGDSLPSKDEGVGQLGGGVENLDNQATGPGGAVSAEEPGVGNPPAEAGANPGQTSPAGLDNPGLSASTGALENPANIDAQAIAEAKNAQLSQTIDNLVGPNSTVEVKPGSTIWQASDQLIKNALPGFSPSNTDIANVAAEISKANNIGGPLNPGGLIPETSYQPGDYKVPDSAKQFILNMAKK